MGVRYINTDIKPVNRADGKSGKGKSVVAMAAYRSKDRLWDERQGRSWEYKNRDDVYFSEIIAPAHAAEWMKKRETLWNVIEETEKRFDSRLTRQFELCLPKELTHEQKIEATRNFIQAEFTSKGIIADVAYHNFTGESAHNPHVHILISTRQIEEITKTADKTNLTKAQRKIISNEERKLYQTHKILKNLGHEPKDNKVFGNKIRELDEKELFVHWREAWAHHCNRGLEQAGLDLRITVKSLEARGITDQIPINEPLKIAEMRKNHEQNPDENPLPEICKLNDEFKKLNLLVKYRKEEIAKEQAKDEHSRDKDYLTWLQAKLEQEIALVKTVKEFRKQEQEAWKKERGFDSQPKQRKKRQRKNQEPKKQHQETAIAVAQLQNIEPVLSQAEINAEWEKLKKQERIEEIQEIRLKQAWRNQEHNNYLQERQQKQTTFDPLLARNDNSPQPQQKSPAQQTDPTPEQTKVKGKEPRDPTYQIVKRQLDLMGGTEFEIGIFDRAEDKMRNRTWSKDEILQYDPDTQKAKIVNWLKLQNQQGKDIYIRLKELDGKQQGLILLDDIDGVTVEEMKAAGLSPAAVVETSPKNLQAWVRVSHGLLERDEARTISKLLAKQWGGDKGSAGFQHYGRLAGFSNRKEEHRDVYSGKYPFARLFYKDSSGAIAPNAEHLISESRTILEQEKIDRANLPVPHISQRPATDREKAKALEMFTGFYHEQIKKGGKLDYSNVDYGVLCRMAKRNWNPDALAHALTHGSPNLADRKSNVPYYVGVTLKKVFESKEVLQAIAENQSKRQKRENKTTSAIQKSQEQKGEQHQAREFTDEDQRKLIEIMKWQNDGKFRTREEWSKIQDAMLGEPPVNDNIDWKNFDFTKITPKNEDGWIIIFNYLAERELQKELQKQNQEREAKIQKGIKDSHQQAEKLKPQHKEKSEQSPPPIHHANDDNIERNSSAKERANALRDFRRIYKVEYERYGAEHQDDLDRLICFRLAQRNHCFDAIRYALRHGSHNLIARKQQELNTYLQQTTRFAVEQIKKNRTIPKEYTYPAEQRQKIKAVPQRTATNENKQQPTPAAVGKLTAADAARLQQMALQSKLSQQQLDRALKALHHHHNSKQDYSKWKRLDLCKLEYLRELGRKYHSLGKEKTLTPGTDVNITMRLKAAGFTPQEIRMTIARESAITAAIESHANRGKYINAAIRPMLESPKMQEVETKVQAWRQEHAKTNPHLAKETRLDKLGLATDWHPPKEQPKQQTRDTTPKPPRAPEHDKRDREPEL
ncbi:MAG: MobA/MobL family protein [Brasilonema angustatum HA4187-MV1]|nr:MobA/MobL family protein [Brasilonema angustatum HA4187-MV1]